MSAENPAFAVSSLSLLGLPTARMLALPVRGFADTAADAGYDDGIEWHPIRFGTAALQIQFGFLTEYEKQAITRLHQSYRGEPDMNAGHIASYAVDRMTGGRIHLKGSDHPAFHHARRSEALQAQVLYERTESIRKLILLKSIVQPTGKMPIVLYPGPEKEELNVAKNHFSPRLIQPTPDVMRQWEVTSLEGMTKKLLELGYTGYAFDPYHFQDSHESGTLLPDARTAIEKLFPYIQELHIRGGLDVSRQGSDPVGTVRDLLSLKPVSAMARVLEIFGALGYRKSVVIEITAAELAAVHGVRFLSARQLIQDHRQLLYNCSELLIKPD